MRFEPTLMRVGWGEFDLVMIRLIVVGMGGRLLWFKVKTDEKNSFL